jgi:RND family efflux transporter MFP subunit
MTKKTKIIGVVGVLLAIGVLLFFQNKNRLPTYEIVSVVKKDIIQNVLATGKVQASESLNLSFESAGKVAEVKTKVGAEVKKGQVLVRQNSDDEMANVRRSAAVVSAAIGDVSMYISSVESEKIKLEQLKNGTRNEELSVALSSREQARFALVDAERSLENTKNKNIVDLENTYADVPETMESSYTSANTAFLENISGIFLDSRDYEQLSFVTGNESNKTLIERERIAVENTMNTWRLRRANFPLDAAGKEIFLKESKQYLNTLRNFLSNLSLCVDDSFDLSLATQNAYRSSVNIAKSSVNIAMATLVAQEQEIASQKIANTNALQSANTAVTSAQKALDLAEKQYQLKLAGPRREEIAEQETRVKQAEANLLSARARVSQARADYQSSDARYKKTVISSPIDGLVSVLEAKVGEFSGPTTLAVSVISRSDYQIETNISEIDIAKLEIGKEAQVTLDAYGENVIFPAQIAKIDPAETIVDGISTYKVTLQFVNKDDRVKSGMTANTKILIENHPDVMAVPIRALLSHDGKNFIKIQNNPKKLAEEQEVEVGLRGSDGMLEITKGLTVGQNIVVSETES